MSKENEVPQTKKGKKKWPWVVAALAVVIVIGAAANGGNSSGSTSNAPTASNTVSSVNSTTPAAAANATASKAPAQKAYSTTLVPGYYEIGVDVPVGTYNFEIVSGNGNVTNTSGSINLIMGKQSDDMYQKTYNNAELTDGDTLFVQQCSIKISTKTADMQIRKRDNSSAKAANLSSGNYTVGKDFKPGYYDISLASGSGNVICMDNQLNAIFSKDNTLGVKICKNVPFKDGYKLQVEGAKIKLTPSK